jgi:hypothetical protein
MANHDQGSAGVLGDLGQGLQAAANQLFAGATNVMAQRSEQRVDDRQGGLFLVGGFDGSLAGRIGGNA